MKSFRPKDGSGIRRAGAQRRARLSRRAARNDTHASTTDRDARLYRKGPGKEARLCFMGHALMENRNALVVGAAATHASGHAERQAALSLIAPFDNRPQPVTLGADKSLPLRRQGATTAAILSPPAAPGRSPRISPRTRTGGARRSIAAPPAIPAMPSRSASVNASKRSLAGPRVSPGGASCGTAACPRSIGNSPSPWPLTISSACPNYWPKPQRDPRSQIGRVMALVGENNLSRSPRPRHYCA